MAKCLWYIFKVTGRAMIKDDHRTIKSLYRMEYAILNLGFWHEELRLACIGSAIFVSSEI